MKTPPIIDSFDGDYRFLSNYWPCEIHYKGIVYSSTEHAYQAQKATEEHFKHLIANLSSPGKAKKMGRNIVVREDWQQVKVQIMYELLCLKFKYHCQDLRQKLIDTGDSYLIEGNTWKDTFWGIHGDVGRNYLGLLLMKVRKEIKEEDTLESLRHSIPR